MVSKRTFFAVLLAATLAGSASAAPTPKSSRVGQVAKHPVVVNQILQIDAPMTILHRTGDRTLVAFWTPGGVVLVVLPIRTEYETYGINDAPEGVDPLGQKENGIRPTGPSTANSTPPLP